MRATRDRGHPGRFLLGPAAALVVLAASPARADLICSPVFQEDFEAGGTSRWESTYGTRPGVTTRGAISGTYSLSSTLGALDALEKFVPTQTNVRLSFTVDASSVNLRNSQPVIASLSQRASNHDLVWVNLGTSSGGGLAVSALFFGRSNSTSAADSASEFPIATRSRVVVEWEKATSATTGVVHLYANGVLLWTSRPNGDDVSVTDALYLGNMYNVGSGALLFDDVLLESCSPAPPDAGVSPPPDAGVELDAATVVPTADAPIVADLATAREDGASPLDAGDGADSSFPVAADGAIRSDAGASPPDPALPPKGNTPRDAGAAVVDLDLHVGCACSMGARRRGHGGLPMFLAIVLIWRRRPQRGRSAGSTPR